MHPLNQKYDKVFCLSLKERPDRRSLINKRFEREGINVEFVEGVKHGFIKSITPGLNMTGGAISATIDHYNIIKKALLDGLNHIFIFEDDTIFINDFRNLSEIYLENAPEDADILYFYLRSEGFINEKELRVNDYWAHAKGACVSAYGLNRKAMKMLIYEMDNRFGVIDAVIGRFHKDSPGYIAALECYSTTPNLCLQDFSDNSNIAYGQTLEYMKRSTTNMWNAKWEDYN